MPSFPSVCPSPIPCLFLKNLKPICHGKLHDFITPSTHSFPLEWSGVMLELKLLVLSEPSPLSIAVAFGPRLPLYPAAKPPLFQGTSPWGCNNYYFIVKLPKYIKPSKTKKLARKKKVSLKKSNFKSISKTWQTKGLPREGIPNSTDKKVLSQVPTNLSSFILESGEGPHQMHTQKFVNGA